MKWQDNMKETLEKRTIKPSDASWGTLADQLDANDRSKSKAPYWWMVVAASVVAVLFITIVFFSDSTIETQKPVLVDTQKKVDADPIPMDKLPQQEQVAGAHQANENLEPIQKNASKKEPLTKQNNLALPIKQSLNVAKNEKEESIKPLEIIPHRDIIEDEKVSEIVAHIQDLKSQGKTVTDTDIDALLAQAQREIAYQTILKESTASVDANALLQEVESDLQKSFRNKVFEALITSYETLKTAVAERKN